MFKGSWDHFSRFYSHLKTKLLKNATIIHATNSFGPKGELSWPIRMVFVSLCMFLQDTGTVGLGSVAFNVYDVFRITLFLN